MFKELVVKIGLPVVLIAVVCSIVLVAHWPVLSAKALSFDDEQYFTKNVVVQNPGLASTKRFFTEVFAPQRSLDTISP